MRKLWCISLLALLAGCVSPRERLDSEIVGQVGEGAPREYVHRVLGAPFDVVIATDGCCADEYLYGCFVFSPRSGYSLEKDLRVRSVVVVYSHQHRVQRVDASEATIPGNVWRERKGFGQAFSGEIRNRIKPGETTRDEVVALFGDPFIEGGHPAGGRELVWLDFYADTGDLVRFPGREYRVRIDDEGIVKEARFNGAANRWPR